MLVAAAIWSVVVLVGAGWSLAMLYKSEAERSLDDDIDNTILTLTSAIDTDPVTGAVSYNNSPVPKDERFNRVYSGWYWAFISLDLENKTYAPMPDGESQSLFRSRPEIPAKLISTAITQPRAPAHGDADGPNDQDLRIGVRAVKLPDRSSPILIYVGINRAEVNRAVNRFTLVMGTALAVSRARSGCRRPGADPLRPPPAARDRGQAVGCARRAAGQARRRVSARACAGGEGDQHAYPPEPQGGGAGSHSCWKLWRTR